MMAAFLAGIFVTLFLGLVGVGSYYLGLQAKTKPTIPEFFNKELSEEEYKQRLEQERYKKDFNVMMNYNQSTAYQPIRELGE